MPVASPNEAICGYTGPYAALVADEVKQGISVQMLVGDVSAGLAVPLRFRVCRKPQETPVDDLQVEHEKLMHVIGVREDLGGFFHFHPRRSAPGLWEMIHTFTNGGRYQVWSDIKQQGTLYSFAHPRLTVSGPLASRPRDFIPKLVDEKAGYRITLQSTGMLEAGRTNSLEIFVRDAFGAPVATGNFLGALMHLIVIKDDVSVYLHAHAQSHARTAWPVAFNQVFPRPGNYKLFAQFRPLKSKLPPDEAVLAEFWVKVGMSRLTRAEDSPR